MLIDVGHSPSNWKWIETDLWKYAKLIYACILLNLFNTNRDLVRPALQGFVTSMVLILALTWISVWVEIPWTWSTRNNSTGNHSVFGDYIVENVMMSLFCILSAYRSWSSGIRTQKICWGTIALLSFISITVLSVGRTGFLVLVTGLCTAILVGITPKWRISIFSLLVLGGILSFTASSNLQNRFTLAVQEAQNHENPETSIGHRLYNYQTILEMISEKPVLGHGTGAFHTEICRFLKPGMDCQIYNWHPHNQFLFFTADYGILGLLVYAGFIIGLYKTAFRSLDPEAKTLLASFASILLIDSLFNSPFYSSIESHFFLYMAALLISLSRFQQKR